MDAGCAAFALSLVGGVLVGDPDLIPPPPPPAAPEPEPRKKQPAADVRKPRRTDPAPQTPPSPPPTIPEADRAPPMPLVTTVPEEADEDPRESKPRRAERARVERAEPDADDPVRRGYVVSGSIGYAGCSNRWCQGYDRGLGGGAELGMRFNIWMPIVGYNGGSGNYSRSGLSDEIQAPITNRPKIKAHTVGAGLLVFPLGNGVRRIDSFFGGRIGFGSVALDYESGSVDAAERVRRGVVTLSGGVEGFVTPHLALGLRLDAHIMFAGKNCTTFSSPGAADEKVCDSASDLGSRTDPRDWPFPFNVGAGLRYIWGF